MPDPSKPQETQRELFWEFAPDKKKGERLPGVKSLKPILLATSAEQVILAGILLILMGCLIFFLGVLRGRSLVGTRPLTPSTAAIRPPAAARPAERTSLATTVPAPPAPPPPPAAPVSRTPILDRAKPYAIQLVAFKKRDLAEREASVWTKKNFFTAVLPSDEYYLVYVGQYASKDEAAKDLSFFRARYKDCFLRRRQNRP